jgi:hypothetical protein
MTDQHPITLPSELLQQWATEYWGNPGESIGCGEKYIATQAAQWGADQELEACVNWLADPCAADMPSLASDLRYSRRPKLPSLKEQALKALVSVNSNFHVYGSDIDTIRRALEALDD